MYSALLLLGMCVPSSCSEEDVDQALAVYSEDRPQRFSLRKCTSADVRPEIDGGDIAYM